MSITTAAVNDRNRRPPPPPSDRRGPPRDRDRPYPPRDGDRPAPPRDRDRPPSAREDRPATTYRASDERPPAYAPRRDDRGPAPFARRDNREPRDDRDGREPRDDRYDGPRDREDTGYRREKLQGEKIYGLHAALAAMRSRPKAILQIMHSPALRPRLEEVMQPLLDKGVPLRVLSVDTLDKLCESTHHEGVLLLVTPSAPMSADSVAESLVRTRGYALVLDRVQNPHNIGAILRSSAFFGIDTVLFEAPEGQRVLTPAAVRVAEGGAEHVAIARCQSLPDALARLRKKGVRVVGTDRAADRHLFDAPLAGPCALVLGNEREGLRPDVRAQCDALVSIAGTASVDSLNVSVAAGILLAAAAHARRAKK